jgi:transglutaminase-like putative cysteine protease
MRLSIEHQTVYRYARPVEFHTHRLMIRPMEGHDVQIRSSELQIQPAHQIRWIHDAFDNSIALLTFTEPASELRVVSRVTVEQYNTNPFNFVLEPHVSGIPFQYQPDESIDIAPFLKRQCPEDDEVIRNWIRPFLDLHGRAKTMDFLTALTRSVPMFFSYQPREEPGVQTPAQTLKQRCGSCRDFALLFMEAARYLGLAARFVSGYLCQSSDQRYSIISGATHAWAEVYLPGAGWKGFDPTCGILAADLHVRVAVARQPAQAPPVSGTYVGKNQDFLGLEVGVKAHSLEERHAG